MAPGKATNVPFLFTAAMNPDVDPCTEYSSASHKGPQGVAVLPSLTYSVQGPVLCHGPKLSHQNLLHELPKALTLSLGHQVNLLLPPW